MFAYNASIQPWVAKAMTIKAMHAPARPVRMAVRSPRSLPRSAAVMAAVLSGCTISQAKYDQAKEELAVKTEAVNNAAEIAAVIVAGLRAVVHAVRNGRVIILGIAVGEAIRHQEIDDVVGREALKTAAGGQRRDNRE